MAASHTLKFGFLLSISIFTILLFKSKNFNLFGNRTGKLFNIDYIRNTFLKDNVPFQYISGSIHYSRVPEIYWYDRLLKMKAAGLNTIQIYVPWNFHEYEEGKYDFSGNKDLNKFLIIAEQLDLLVLLRSGPYICGEWDFGGLPAWLLKKNPHMKLRSSDPTYMLAVKRWYSVLLPILKPHLYQNNGSIIMVQVENEYGSYFISDDAYLRSLYDIVRSYLGNEVIIYSTDGNGLWYLTRGSSDRRLFSTVDFGPSGAFNPAAAFSALNIFQPSGPLVNSEYYSGWLDSWGRKHNAVSQSDVVRGLKSLYNYSNSVNVNMYMFHGGTSFGFWNGANSPPYLPQITSYDYDAPISESGDTTLKYFAIRDYIQSLNPQNPLPPVPPNSTKMAYGKIYLTQRKDFLLKLLSQKYVTSKYPLFMELLNQFQGFMIYMTDTVMCHGNVDRSSFIEIDRIGDYAYIFIGNEDNTEITYQGSINRNMAGLTLNINVSAHLIILVENSGHINYGSNMVNDVKGIVGNVTLNGVLLTNWKHYFVDINKAQVSPGSVPYPSSAPSQCGLFTSDFFLSDPPSDTFAIMTTFSKGILFINGQNLGRYWNTKGPQYTLYIPKSVLQPGNNNITIFELEGTLTTSGLYMEFINYPILNGPVH